jgi:hypothetical protein
MDRTQADTAGGFGLPPMQPRRIGDGRLWKRVDQRHALVPSVSAARPPSSPVSDAPAGPTGPGRPGMPGHLVPARHGCGTGQPAQPARLADWHARARLTYATCDLLLRQRTAAAWGEVRARPRGTDQSGPGSGSAGWVAGAGCGLAMLFASVLRCRRASIRSWMMRPVPGMATSSTPRIAARSRAIPSGR